MSNDETDYTDDFASGLELMWGRGFMSPGGPEEVDLVVQDLDLVDKHLLDIGSGLGGPATCLVLRHNVSHVTGIDLEPRNVERARNYSIQDRLSDRLTFIAVDGGALPFDGDSFDGVFSKDAVTEAPNKDEIFAEAYRVLRPGGWLAMSDWFCGDSTFTSEMKDWLKVVGVVLEMATIDSTAELLTKIGFVGVQIEDRNEWYRNYSLREVERMRGEDRPRFEKLFGKSTTEEWISETTLKTQVVAQGQLRPGHIRAKKP